jgi:hypothetical protein
MNELTIFCTSTIIILGSIWAFVGRQRDIAAERAAEREAAQAAAALPFDEVDALAYVVPPQSGVIPVAQEVTIENPLPFDPIPSYTHLPFEGEPVAVDAERAIRSRRRARA